MLETVSVFFNLGCSDHAEKEADICCKPKNLNHPLPPEKEQKDSCCASPGDVCDKETSSCCDDEIAVLLHDFDSLLPHFEKWDVALVALPLSFQDFGLGIFQVESSPVPSFSSDGGPPLYIMNGSLIFYA